MVQSSGISDVTSFVDEVSIFQCIIYSRLEMPIVNQDYWIT